MTTLTPASSTLTLQNSSKSCYITGSTAVGNSLTFSAQITNPTSVQSLASQIFVVYSNTQFIEQLSVVTMSLAPLTFSPAVVVSDFKTSFNSTYNISISLPYSITGGFTGSVAISYINLVCSTFSLLSSASILTSSCNSNNFTFTSPNATLSPGLFWISFPASNYYSTINNSVAITLASPAPSYYIIGSGVCPLALSINSHEFSVTNSNPVFSNETTFQIS